MKIRYEIVDHHYYLGYGIWDREESQFVGPYALPTKADAIGAVLILNLLENGIFSDDEDVTE